MEFDDGLEAKLKARIFVGYLAYLTKEHHIEGVRERFSRDMLDAIDAGLPSTSWVNVAYFIELCNVVGALHGPAEVRRMARWGTRTATFVTLRPILEGIAGLFGATPNAFLQRLSLGMRPLCSGFNATFTPSAARAGKIALVSRYCEETPMTSEAWAAVFEEVVELAPARATVRVGGRAMQGPHSHSQFLVSWEPQP